MQDGTKQIIRPCSRCGSTSHHEDECKFNQHTLILEFMKPDKDNDVFMPGCFNKYFQSLKTKKMNGDLIVQSSETPEKSIADAVRIAAKTGEEVQFKDGNIVVFIHPESYVGDSRSLYMLKTDLKAERKATEELLGIKQALEKHIEVNKMQTNEIARLLHKAIAKPNSKKEVMRWVGLWPETIGNDELIENLKRYTNGK